MPPCLGLKTSSSVYLAIQLDENTLLPSFARHCGDIGEYVDCCSTELMERDAKTYGCIWLLLCSSDTLSEKHHKQNRQH